MEIREEQLNDLLEKAAEKGAVKALGKVGLHDEGAGKDITDLRSLLELWRSMCSTAVATAVRVVVVGIIAGLAALFGSKFYH
jgi:hypothetical protein